MTNDIMYYRVLDDAFLHINGQTIVDGESPRIVESCPVVVEDLLYMQSQLK